MSEEDGASYIGLATVVVMASVTCVVVVLGAVYATVSLRRKLHQQREGHASSEKPRKQRSVKLGKQDKKSEESGLGQKPGRAPDHPQR